MEKPLKINKTIALLILIANAIYVVFGVVKIYYSQKPPMLSGPGAYRSTYYYTAPLNSAMSFFLLIILCGLLWLLIAFKERKWLWSGVIVNFALKVLSVAAMFVIYFYAVSYYGNYRTLTKVLEYVAEAGMLYTAFTCLFARNKIIRPGLISFGLSYFLIQGLVHAAGYLYDNFGIHWLYTHLNNIIIVPYIITLMLFIRVYNAARKQDKDQEAPLPPRQTAFNFNQ